MRHLASMGYRLGYEQDPRTEFEFGVANMSVDLRSGVRLLRAAELLTGAYCRLGVDVHGGQTQELNARLTKRAKNDRRAFLRQAGASAHGGGCITCIWSDIEAFGTIASMAALLNQSSGNFLSSYAI